MLAKTAFLSLVAAASAVDVLLYSGRDNTCAGNSFTVICFNAGVRGCCQEPSRVFSSAGFRDVDSSVVGAIFVRSATSGEFGCGQRIGSQRFPVCLTDNGQIGGIQGARWEVVNGRSADSGPVEPQRPTAVEMSDGSRFAINGDVPQNVTKAIWKKLDNGAATADDMSEFEEYAI